MLFSHILGNEAAKQTLTGLLEQKRLPHALLFAGPDGVGKSLFALETAQALLGEKAHARCATGTHPDLHSLRPEGKAELHTIEAVRALIEEAAFPPFEAPCKVFILYEADRMLPTSSNALLKTLEEPQPHTYFLLLTSHEGAILSTIASRTRKIPFFPVPRQQSIDSSGYFGILQTALQTGDCSKLTLEENVPDTDLLLEAIFAFHRDRHLAAATKNAPQPSPSLEEVLEKLLIARSALERHTSLRTVLEYVIH